MYLLRNIGLYPSECKSELLYQFNSSGLELKVCSLTDF